MKRSTKKRAEVDLYAPTPCTKCGRELGEHDGTKCPKPDKAAAANEAARRAREQIARALTPREQLELGPAIAASSRSRITNAGHKATGAIGAESARSRNTPGEVSRNRRDRERGLYSVISVRIDPGTLQRIDDEIEASIGTRVDLTRSALILEAVRSHLTELARQRRRAA